jgi:hypothetical protein
MSKKNRANSKGMLPDGHLQKTASFFMAPHALFANDRYLNLSVTQRSLLFDLCAQFDGSNNGDLALNTTFCKAFHWSYYTVKANRGKLVESGLVRHVGSKPLNNYKVMKLYALAWLPINEESNEYINKEELNRKELDLKFDRGRDTR